VIGRTLFRYVLGEMLRTLLVALAWLMMIGVLGVLVRARFTSAGQLLGMGACLGMLPLLLPYIFSMVLPPAVLAASCSVYGRLSAENELVAMRAAGISWRSASVAPLILGLVASLSMVWLNLEGFRYAADWLTARERSSELDVNQLCRPGASLQLDSGESRLAFTFGQPGDGARRPVTVMSSGRNARGFQLMAREFDDPLVRTEELGQGRRRRFVTFTLRSVHVVTDPFNPRDKEEFAEYRLPEIELPAGMSRGLVGGSNMRVSLGENLAQVRAMSRELERRYAAMALSEEEVRSRLLAAAAGSGGVDAALAALRERDGLVRGTSGLIEDIRDARAEAARKLAFSFSPLIFALLGVGMGAAARKASKLVSLSLGVVAAAAYYGVWVGGRACADFGLASPELAAWLPNVLGLAAAWLVVYRQNRS